MFRKFIFSLFPKFGLAERAFQLAALKKIKPPNYFSKSHTRVLKKKYSGDFYKGKKCKQTKESKKIWKNLQIKKSKCHLLFDDSEEDWVKNYYYYTIVQRCISTNAKLKKNQSPLKRKSKSMKAWFYRVPQKEKKNTFFLSRSTSKHLIPKINTPNPPFSAAV